MAQQLECSQAHLGLRIHRMAAIVGPGANGAQHALVFGYRIMPDQLALAAALLAQLVQAGVARVAAFVGHPIARPRFASGCHSS
ncbi:hypothetical protein GPA19_15915 [Azoarcus indigens]|uniref:hypothetical protein n=1 Tax=Azoarcus indigens TaxID=29545 RepID=UPI00105C180B|nr:hypothetical protein [Azoarcus indigens]NMG66431.1 hypothetical protein [Azoarcus indigens]